jgi:hypothetical protein
LGARQDCLSTLPYLSADGLLKQSSVGTGHVRCGKVSTLGCMSVDGAVGRLQRRRIELVYICACVRHHVQQDGPQPIDALAVCAYVCVCTSVGVGVGVGVSVGVGARVCV